MARGVVAGLALAAAGSQLAFTSVGAPRSAVDRQMGRASLAGVQAAETSTPASAAFVGAAMGLSCAVGVVTTFSKRRAARVAAAAVAPGAPSLIQILEQKRLLSAVQDAGLLSKAEAAGIKANVPEELGLLVLAEELGLLSTTEAIVTNPSTPALLLAAGAALAGLAYLDLTQAPFGFPQYVIAGALGAPALVAAVAGVAIAVLFGGARRTQNLDMDDEELVVGDQVFTTKAVTRSVTLLDVLEQKKLLSFVEKNRLLSLATGVIDRPLTLTEKLGVLSTLEKTGLLSAIESSASDMFGAAKVGLLGVGLLLAALLLLLFGGELGATLALLAALPGLAVTVVGIVLAIFQAPRTKIR